MRQKWRQRRGRQRVLTTEKYLLMLSVEAIALPLHHHLFLLVVGNRRLNKSQNVAVVERKRCYSRVATVIISTTSAPRINIRRTEHAHIFVVFSCWMMCFLAYSRLSGGVALPAVIGGLKQKVACCRFRRCCCCCCCLIYNTNIDVFSLHREYRREKPK